MPQRQQHEPGAAAGSASHAGRGDGGTGRAAGRRHPGVDIDEAPVSSLLLQVVRAHALVGTEMLQRIGLIPPHEVVLLHLGDHGEVPQSDLVRFLGRDRSTVTNTLQAMERAELVTRRPSPTDARAMVVALTPRGRAMLPDIRRTWADLESLTTSGLDSQQKVALIAALRTIRSTLGEALERSAAGAGGTAAGPAVHRRDEVLIDSELMAAPGDPPLRRRAPAGGESEPAKPG
jgi:DNA-binding MarR family transcriptional regulator